MALLACHPPAAREPISNKMRTDTESQNFRESRSTTLEVGESLTGHLVGANVQGLRSLFAPVMAEQFSFDDINAIVLSLGDDPIVYSQGSVIRNLEERYYLAEIDTKKGSFMLSALVNSTNLVAMMTLEPIVTPYRPQTTRSISTQVEGVFPTDGSWIAAWGGDTYAENHHVLVESQIFANDLTMWHNNSTYSGEGSKNEDYWAWDRPVVAPVGGKVVSSENNIVDNKPGPDTFQHIVGDAIWGNHVVIKTDHGFYVVIAHLREGSVRVALGDHVVTGQPLGTCGNSGRSSEPHVHLHAQTTGLSQPGLGVPIAFVEIAVNGELRQRSVLLQGDIVSKAKQ